MVKSRQLENHHWSISSEDAMAMLTVTMPSSYIAARRMAWAGHLVRMTDSRLVKLVTFGSSSNNSGIRPRPPRGARAKTWLQLLDEDGERVGARSWRTECCDRPRWRELVSHTYTV